MSSWNSLDRSDLQLRYIFFVQGHRLYIYMYMYCFIILDRSDLQLLYIFVFVQGHQLYIYVYVLCYYTGPFGPAIDLYIFSVQRPWFSQQNNGIATRYEGIVM